MTATTAGMAMAGGWCRLGTAQLQTIGNGQAILTCSESNGICYETDNTGIVAPGHHIVIHMVDGQLIDAVIVKSSPNPNPPTTPPSQPTTELPSVVVVKPNQD